MDLPDFGCGILDEGAIEVFGNETKNRMAAILLRKVVDKVGRSRVADYDFPEGFAEAFHLIGELRIAQRDVERARAMSYDELVNSFGLKLLVD